MSVSVLNAVSFKGIDPEGNMVLQAKKYKMWIIYFLISLKKQRVHDDIISHVVMRLIYNVFGPEVGAQL